MLQTILLDSRPDYLRTDDGAGSLLLAPIGTDRLVTLLDAAFNVSACAPIVMPTFAPTDAYRARMELAYAGVDVLPVPEFRPSTYEASDWFLFIDPRLYCLDELRLSAMLRDSARPRAGATHLVAMARHSGGTSERVELSSDGRVRRIQRYFDSTTWPMLTGVACSLVSAACLSTTSDELTFESLADLRTVLAGRGVPSRDVPIAGAVYSLTNEGEFLRVNELTVLVNSPNRALEAHVDASASVDVSARLIGPVVVQGNATIERGATIVGPAVIGPGARVAADATVCQSVIGEGVTVPANAVVNYRVILSSEPHDTDVSSFEPGSDAEGPEIDIEADQPAPGTYSVVKSLIDSSLAAIGLIILSPLLACIAALIKMDSEGPVFYPHMREGKDGTLFPCLKFRTMRVGADLRQRELLGSNDMDGPQFKLEKDPRLTRLGRWLRPMSLDELPQLLNILRGQMSLVGPRPSPFRENQTCVPWRDARLSVRPGITGLWQVCRHDRTEGDFHQWIYFDLLYVQHMSLWLDLKIVVATILTRGGQKSVPVQRLIAGPRLQP